MRKPVVLEELPKTLQDLIRRYPQAWEAYDELGKACHQAGPLDDKTVALVKVGIAGALRFETALKTHVRLARQAGATDEEIRHVLLQLWTTAGLPTTVMAIKWAGEVD